MLKDWEGKAEEFSKDNQYRELGLCKATVKQQESKTGFVV